MPLEAWHTEPISLTAPARRRFIRLCLMHRLVRDSGNILPASEGTLSYFATYLAPTVRHSTIKIYLAAVRNLRISCGYRDPLEGFLPYQGQRKTLRQPVTPGVLLSI